MDFSLRRTTNIKKIILNCHKCGAEVERENLTKNPVCFECKTERIRKHTAKSKLDKV